MSKQSKLLLAFALSAVTVQWCHGFGSPAFAVRSWTTISAANPTFPRGASLIRNLAAEDETPSFDNNEEPISASTSGETDTQTVKDQSVAVVKSIFQRIDDGGQKLKPMALTAKDKADTDDRKKSVMYTIKSCFLFSLFILYRAYRGFFVILPAVFREVSNKMGSTLVNPFDESLDQEGAALENDINPKTGKVRLRTRVTVSVFAGFVTIWYVVGGALRVCRRFVKSVFSSNSKNVVSSFEAAAEEIEGNEVKFLRLAKKDSEINDGNINGEGLTNLAP